ncbi:unnamed protein product [Peronospora farinosa]|uniref:PH domain-containing protein n=1 Tax=Peronospora farinosa TaxID=134698 RepID=A0AAV0UVL0_9STRA|nr:unnamed protein product [Peronospora farinosa]CAI5740502.1 unnamed protein product [Peronospora farinosa]
MYALNATSSESRETRQHVAQQQFQGATKQVVALRRIVRSSYCDHSGWGYKQGRIIKSWKRRYFVLKGREFIYFTERSPNGKGIDEKGRLCINSVERTPECTNALMVRGELKNQAVKIQVDSNDECTEWFDKLSEALQEAMTREEDRGHAGRNAAVFMKGWLLKEGQNFKTWKRRYMTLTGRVIQYRAQPNEKPLGETRVNAVNINPSRSFALDIYSDNNRILRISADSFADIEAWDHALAKVTGKRPCFGDPYAGQDAPFLGETFEESVLCEGWLYKRGQRSTEWQRRYFKLKGYKLQYQNGPGESVPKGAGTVVGLKLGEMDTNCVFVQLESGRVLCVSADSRAFMDKWVQAICKLLDKDSKTLKKEVATTTAAVSIAVSSSNRLRRAFSRAGSGATLPLVLPTYRSSARLTPASQSSLVCAGESLDGIDDTTESDNNNFGQLMPDSSRPLSGIDSNSATSPRASSTGLIRKYGWLRKEGARNRSLKRRYFMADGNKLYYFEQIGEAPRGNGIVKSAVPNDIYPNCLDLILMSGRTLRVVAESPDEIRSWLDHFNDCISVGDITEARDSALERLSRGAGEDTALSVTESGSGWLLKKGKNFKNWKRRFFKLEGKHLSYSSAPDAPSLGRGVLANVAIGNARPFCLDVRFQNGRVMNVVAGNESEMMAWNRLLQTGVLSEPIESDLEQDVQFDFDDAEEDAHLDTMHTVVTAATAFKRGLSKASSTVNKALSDDSLKQRTEPMELSTSKGAEKLVKPTNERVEVAVKNVAAAAAEVDRNSLRLGIAEMEEPVVCSGWLQKEGGTVKNWKRRYFTLHGTTLCYFKSYNGALLRSFTVCHVVTLRTKRLCLEITTEVGRKLLVASETQTDLDRWLDHLHRAIAAEKRKKQHGGDALQWTKDVSVATTPSTSTPEPGSLAYMVL